MAFVNGNIVVDSAALAAFAIPVGGITPGAKVFNQVVGADFIYTISDAALVPDVVVSVNGRPDARWIKYAAGDSGTPDPAPDAVPKSLGGGYLDPGWMPPGLSNVEIYASPDGDDDNDGNSWARPFKTGYAAAAALVAQGGGTLHLADDCEIGNPVSGMGLCFRGDGFDVPGFLPTVPMVIKCHGKSEGAGPFQDAGAARIIGGGGRKSPSLWIVASNQQIRVEYFTPKFPHEVEAKIGSDFIRKVDGTLLDVAITTSTRTGTSTVHTVTLPTAITIDSASRAGSVVTLTITNPGMPYIPFRLGSKVRFASTNEAQFPSGDYTLLSSGNPIANNTTWTVTYDDGGAATATQSSPGTIASHGCNPGDLIELSSTNVHFQSGQYRVTATTIDTITVTDVFGDGDSTQANIGTLVRHERFLSYAAARLFRCGFGLDEYDTIAGPSVDVGHSQGVFTILDECWITGYVGNGTGPRDEDRMAAVLVEAGDSGSIGPPAPSLIMRKCNGSNGTVVVNATNDAVGYVNIDYLLMEANFPALALPVLRVNGSKYTRVVGRDIYNADNAANVPTVVVSGVPLAGTDFKRCGVITGAVVGGDYWLEPSQWNSGLGIQSPWAKQQITPWADGRISGKHPGPDRAFGVYQARYQNVLALPSAWTGGHLTKTTGQLAPDGSLGAVRLQNSVTDFIAMRALTTDGNTWEVGGKLVVCGWINSTSDNDFIPDSLISIVSGGAITFEEGNNAPVPFRGRGWQKIQTVFTVSAVSSSTPSYYPALYLGSGSDAYAYGWTAFYVPADVDDNDAFELAGTARQQPVYLAPGTVGTMEGVPLIGHKGLGSVIETVTLGAANGKSIKAYDEAGNFVGYIELKDAA